MNATQIDLVRSSFARVQPIADTAAAIFYEKLFALDPTLRPLFKGDIAVQGQRLMMMIAAAVRLLDRPTSSCRCCAGSALATPATG